MASSGLCWLRQWLLTLFLGSAFYAAYQGIVHFSDWCYLGVAKAMAGFVSALLIPLNERLLQLLSRISNAGGRWLALLSGTLALFGLANLLTWPLLTWLGPGSTWPWGVAALLVAGALHRRRLVST